MADLLLAGGARRRSSARLSSIPALAEEASRAHYAHAADLLGQRATTLTAPLTSPVHALRPHILARQAAYFCNEFPGTAMYAVKVNPDPLVIDTLAANGIRAFDVASLAEVELVATRVPNAELFFMHPVKPRHAIRAAYASYGVRDFSLDSADELQKIMQETNNAADLGLHIRIDMPKSGKAFHSLNAKFGIAPNEAVALLRKARRHAARLGICFHVGSQMMDPIAWAAALDTVADIIKTAHVRIDSIDVGGGYPVTYAGMTPPPLADFMHTIRSGVYGLNVPLNLFNPATARVLGEPGRVLVAEAGRLICRIDARKDDYLFINDGGYGSLFDAAFTGLVYPATLHRPPYIKGGKTGKKLAPFKLYGPTCDSIDVMPGPFMLPADAREGDFIEFHQTGAYTYSLQSRFNGFYADEVVVFEE
jgi:ornithine decarboxylase